MLGTGEGPLAGAVATPNQLNKGNGKKAVECIVGGSDLCTNDKGEACWKGHVMNTAKGAVTAATLKGCNIK